MPHYRGNDPEQGCHLRGRCRAAYRDFDNECRSSSLGRRGLAGHWRRRVSPQRYVPSLFRVILTHCSSARPDGRVEVQICQDIASIAISHESDTVVALSPSGKLHIASLDDYGSASTIIAVSVTSFTLTPDFLIYGTSSQYSHYAPLPLLQRIITGDEELASNQWETRRIERGALIIAACPSSMSLVLQMPRGNLETIYPRPLVLAVVRRDVLA